MGWGVKSWLLFAVLSLCVVVVVSDTVRLALFQGRVLGILGRVGPLRGCDLVRCGVPRRLVYGVLGRLERKGRVASFLDEEGWKRYRVPGEKSADAR